MLADFSGCNNIGRSKVKYVYQCFLFYIFQPFPIILAARIMEPFFRSRDCFFFIVKFPGPPLSNKSKYKTHITISPHRNLLIESWKPRPSRTPTPAAAMGCANSTATVQIKVKAGEVPGCFRQRLFQHTYGTHP